ncbi:putative phosphoesterase [Cadophora sp. MPI-SDFR-AT-0126]|nr:putative phosphoesterase [Leptodontidium sp. MPI-SDFR-AT-0119]KAH7379092.1 putative phosphoesterase [Leotiomycetes sp. MPI-SDFR-AT-0126]
MFKTQSNNALESLLHRPRPSKWQQFLSSPVLYLARLLYASRKHIQVEPSLNPITVVCISDTHNTFPSIPSGEILIHAGDATQSGTLEEFQATIDWLDSLPHRHKVIIGGNHDLVLDPNAAGTRREGRSAIDWKGVTSLENDSVTLNCVGGRQIKIYGSPFTPKHGNWAFQYPRSRNVWYNTIPEDTDILITHGPPRAHLDLGYGCDYLLDELWRTRPKLHVFGHIHGGYGQERVYYDEQQRAFEEICKAGGGIWRLVLCYSTLVARFSRFPLSSTLLVNAASIGGLRDEKRRAPITVTI